VNGHLYYYFPPGSSLLSLPFVAVFEATGLSTMKPDGGYSRRGEKRMDRRVAAIVAAAYVVIVYLTARLLLSGRASLLIALAVALGTPVWSSASRALWSHTWDLVLLGLVVHHLLAFETGRARLRPVALGTLLAWSYFTRPTSSIALAVIGLWVVGRARHALPLFATTLAVWLGLFVAYSWHHFGRILPHYYSAGRLGLDHLAEALAGNLVSPSRGLLVYVAMLLWVIFLLVRRARFLSPRPLVLASLAVVTLHWVAISGYPHWWGGHSYGPRLMTDTLPWWVFLGVCGLRARQHARCAEAQPGAAGGRLEVAMGIVLVVLSVAANAPGALSRRSWDWNVLPYDVDRHPSHLWDWTDPQFLAWVGERNATPHPPAR
jgi:hypothetical protein